tara:strand:+ start:1026 stop:2336 length:1311 start_codon:yes stop_codon:yes gene_type:complete
LSNIKSILKKNISRPTLRPGIKPIDVLAWSSLDFANSGYTTVVLTAIFNVFFVTIIMEGSDNGTLAWTSILSLSYLTVMVTAPWIGAYVDSTGKHKKILYLATIFCVFPTLCLGFFGPGMFFLCAIFLVISNFSYSVHQDITASYLINLCEQQHLGKISGFGWAWGFVGGLITLILCLLWVSYVPVIFEDPVLYNQIKVSGSMVITASIFGVVSFTAIKKLKKFRYPNHSLNWKKAWHKVLKNLQKRDDRKDIFDFLLCVYVYQSGIASVITIAAIYAKEVMNFNIDQTIYMILIVNITACVGAFGFGWLQDFIGHKLSLLFSLFTWLATVIIIYFAQEIWIFWLAANLAGFAMGASQSGARAAIAHMSPKNEQASNFGLWGFSINAASATGPFVYGLITFLTNNDHRLAIIALGIFFILGILLLLRCQFRGSEEN